MKPATTPTPAADQVALFVEQCCTDKGAGKGTAKDGRYSREFLAAFREWQRKAGRRGIGDRVFFAKLTAHARVQPPGLRDGLRVLGEKEWEVAPARALRLVSPDEEHPEPEPGGAPQIDPDSPEPPPNLGAVAASMFRRLVAEYEIDDVASLHLLGAGLGCLDTYYQLQAEMTASGSTVVEGTRGKVAHPAIGGMNQMLNRWQAVLKQLGIDTGGK